MAQTRKVRGVATSIRTEGEWTHVRYHDTDVVSFNDNVVVLRTGGWYSVTTKTRMNQASCQFNLGFTVYQKRGEWFVGYWDSDKAIPFVGGDGMTIKNRPMKWTGEKYVPVRRKQVARV